MFSYIILRDIPKKAVQLDFSIYEVQGGFRGFAEVFPGIHYISIEMDTEMIEGFWCYLHPSSVIVKVYDYTNKLFEDDTFENKARYSQMALNGAMNRALIPVTQRNAKMSAQWTRLTSQIGAQQFPVQLHHEVPMEPPTDQSDEELSEYYLKKYKSRFEQAFYNTHKGDAQAFLAEFQYSYVKFVINRIDNNSLNRWTYLIQAVYNAGEQNIRENPNFFFGFVDILIEQFKFLANEIFTGESKLVYGASYFIEDLIDSDIEKLKAKAEFFMNYLESRGISI